MHTRLPHCGDNTCSTCRLLYRRYGMLLIPGDPWHKMPCNLRGPTSWMLVKNHECECDFFSLVYYNSYCCTFPVALVVSLVVSFMIHVQRHPNARQPLKRRSLLSRTLCENMPWNRRQKNQGCHLGGFFTTRKLNEKDVMTRIPYITMIRISSDSPYHTCWVYYAVTACIDTRCIPVGLIYFGGFQCSPRLLITPANVGGTWKKSKWVDH